MDDELLRFFQAVRDIRLRTRRCLAQGREDRKSEVLVRREDEHPAALLG